jgi:drug/metabolite transporter (DMT)-like permease
VRPSDALGITAMLAWGAAYVPSAWLVETWPPVTAAGARLTLAGVLLLGLLAALRRPLRPGAAVVVWDGPLWPPALSPGALVVVGGALAWSIGTVVAARGVRGRAEPLALAGWQMTAGGVVLAAAGVAGEGPPDATGAREVALIVVLAAVGSALPLALFYIALVQAPAAEVSAWFFLVPVVGVLTAWPLLGETPTAQLLAGMAGVSAGLWLVLGRAASGPGRLVDSPTPP